MSSPKKYIVWYKSGAGGFFVGWLLQTALDPALLENALAVFPLTLKEKSQTWKQFERTPHEVGLICNMFHANTYYALDAEGDTRHVIESILAGNNKNIDTLLHCRIKFYLMNYVYRSGHVTLQNLLDVTTYPEKYQLTDMEYVKRVTDVLFDVSKNIFVNAPERYLELAAQSKNCRHYPTPVNKIIAEYPVKIFQLETVWQGGWEAEISKTLGLPLSISAKSACEKLIKRYLEVMPAPLKEFCNVN
jgi:hypothetical protein